MNMLRFLILVSAFISHFGFAYAQPHTES